MRTVPVKGLERRLLARDLPSQLMGRDLLKYIALVLMTLGHWALDIYALIPSKGLLRFFVAAEYFAPPVFFFFISEGYHCTRSRRRYAVRLLSFAVIAQIPHALVYPGGLTVNNLLLHWNVMMTLFLGLLALMALHSGWRLPLRLLAAGALMGVSWLQNCEWAVSGILIMLLLDLLRERPLVRLGAYMLLMVGVVTAAVGRLPDGMVLLRYLLPVWTAGVVITFFYSGKKGRFPVLSKYLFYVWYPLHLMLQWLFRLMRG